MKRKRKTAEEERAARARLARRGQAIERKPYLQSAQEGGPDLDPELGEDKSAPGTFGSERSGPQ